MATMTKAKRIAWLNDLARTAMGIASRVYQTEGINALPPADQSRIRELVETFGDDVAPFTPDNDPYGEHDFGSFVYRGSLADDVKIFWKIDYFDRNYEYGSEDPSDASQTRRVLTIMLASEY